MYSVSWNATIVHHLASTLDHSLALEGHKAYITSREEKATVAWSALKSYSGELVLDEDIDKLEICEEGIRNNNSVVVDNDVLRTLEGLPNINWDIDAAEMVAPLHKHASIAKVMNPDLFADASALTCFLRYIPLAFWKQVCDFDSKQ